MKELAENVWKLSGFPPNAVNVYLLEDVVVDAGTRFDGPRIMHQLRGRDVRAHALTHAHPDHQGASRRICTELGVPFWVGAADADAAENPKLIGERQPGHFGAWFFYATCTGPGHPVDRQLREGDEVAGFQVLEVPGHSAGHLAFWRESDRVLVAGDVFNTADPLTLLPGLKMPKNYFTPDPPLNRRSAKRLADLEPELLLVGHGAPLRDPGKLSAFAATLPV